MYRRKSGLRTEPWTAPPKQGTMAVMRVDMSGHGEHDHDHEFGTGAHHAEPHDVGLGAEAHLADRATHGLFDHLDAHGEHAASAALGGHVEIGHFDHDFHGEGTLHGLDGLHDSIHNSLGLGFGGDEHHTLHDGLHHDPAHDPSHTAHDDPQHHDISHIFH